MCNETLYIIEIPHRLPANLWSAVDEKALLSIIAKEYGEYVNSSEEAHEILARDLHACFILTVDELTKFEWSGHQAHKVRSEIARAIAEDIPTLDFNESTEEIFRKGT